MDRKKDVVLGGGYDVYPREIEEGLMQFGRERLAAYKYPRIVTFVEFFPLGPSGKILKRELAARFTGVGTPESGYHAQS